MWSRSQDRYYPSEDVVDKLPPGLYAVRRTMFSLLLQRLDIQEDNFILFGKRKKIVDGVKKFRQSGKEFKKYKFTFKRGYLFYGPPGTGKTALVREIIKQNPDAVALLVDDVDDIKGAYDMIQENEPGRTIIFCIEDIDCHDTSDLTNIMDGALALDNVIFLATTNFVGDIEERVLRPGRFDEIIKIDKLDADERRAYIKHIFPDLKEDNILKYVEKTDGLSMAEIKNRVIEMKILGMSDDLGDNGSRDIDFEPKKTKSDNGCRPLRPRRR